MQRRLGRSSQRRLARWSARVTLVALGLVATTSMGGCVGGATGGACTMIGCDDAVIFQLPPKVLAGESYAVEACVDGDCRTWGGPPEGSPDVVALWSVPVRADAGRSVAVEVSVVVDGREIDLEVEDRVRLETTYPNGRRCPPGCRSATVTASLAG